MNYGLSTQALSAILSVLSARSGVKRAILYGYRAKGNYREGSDIDLTLRGALDAEDHTQSNWNWKNSTFRGP